MTTLYSIYLFVMVGLYVAFILPGCSVYNDVIYIFTITLDSMGKGHALGDMILSHSIV